MNRNYRGYQITGTINGQTGCAGNFQGARIYTVTRDAQIVFSTSTLRDARAAIDAIVDRTDATRAKVAALKAQLIK
jgi:hypothetical protein